MTATTVNDHYGSPGLAARLLQALAAAGKDPGKLERADLMPFEEFHIGGREATRELARLAKLAPGTTVLDVGCGIGGPARTLADEFGCMVTGIDLVDSFIEAARELTRRLPISSAPGFEVADACALPFAPASFDAVVSEHMTMNIADKAVLVAGVRRVLRDGGRYALYEVCKGDGEVRYPVPWASERSSSFLVSPAELRETLDAAGFATLHWLDVSAQARARFAELARTVASWDIEPALGPHLVMGARFREKIANLHRNLEDGRVCVLMAVMSAGPN